MSAPNTPNNKPWNRFKSILFPLILAFNLFCILYLIVGLKDYDAVKKDLSEKSALVQEVSALRFEIVTLKSERDSLELVRKEYSALQARSLEAKAIIAKAEAAGANIDSIRAEEAALNTRLTESRKAIGSLMDNRDKLAEADRAIDKKIARAAATTQELAALQTKLSSAQLELQKIEDSRAEYVRLVSERSSVKAEIAQIIGQKEATQKELETLSKNLGQVQGQVRNLNAQKAELESELAAQRTTAIKK